MKKMQDPIEKIKQEHEEIERELLELETIIESEEVNYPNLVYVLKKITNFWENHEEKEEAIFPLIEIKNNFKMPVQKITFQHKELRPYRQEIVDSINSGNNEKVRQSLEKQAREMIKKLREHIELEDEILYTLLSEQKFSEEEIEKINQKLDNIQ